MGTASRRTRQVKRTKRPGGGATQGEAGFSLTETLIGLAMVVVVIGAVVPVLWIASGQFGAQSDRVSALDQDRVAFDDMTRLIREAQTVRPLEATEAAAGGGVLLAQSLEVITGDAAIDPVVLDCGVPGAEADRFKCVRTQSDGASKDLIDGIFDPAPFAVDTGRGFVSVSLRLSPPQASKPVSLEGGVSVRAPVAE